jgi:beta-1,2-mannobiose phosphorylase / 1,2-beta-oligomannan phosphorylase
MKDPLVIRYKKNPILTSHHWPYSVNTVFNAGAAIVDGETLLLVRVEDRRGVSHLTVARSKDGCENWRIDPEPALAPHPDHPEEQWGVEDPRVTWLEEAGCYAVAYTAYSKLGPLVSLATTRDFHSFERLGPVLAPENKDAALFPMKLKGKWALIHRPVTRMDSGAHIWLSYSPDLVHWGAHQVLLQARSGPYWDAGKIGLSAQPLRTERGWLLLYHGVKNTCFGSIYRQGLALLDLKDPTQVLGRTDEWIMSPDTDYERSGDVGNVVFCCGWTLVGSQVRIYYAGADTCLALATAELSEMLVLLE